MPAVVCLKLSRTGAGYPCTSRDPQVTRSPGGRGQYIQPSTARGYPDLLEYATIVTNGDLIQPEHLRLRRQSISCQDKQSSDRISLSFTFSPEEFSLDAVTRQTLEWALHTCNNNKSSAARLLKASRKLFY